MSAPSPDPAAAAAAAAASDSAAAAPPTPPINVLPYAQPDTKFWHVGTLTYTTAGLVVLFCWLLWGDFTFFLKERAVPPTLQLLLKQFHASDTVMGFLVGSLPPIIGIGILPIISYRSDRHRGRWGRRIPFLLAMTPIAVIAMIALAFSPRIGTTIATALRRPESRSAMIVASFGISWAFFEFSSIVCNAIFGGLANDVIPRQFLGRFFGLFRAMSLGAGILFLHYGLGTAETHYVPIFLGMAALYGVSFTAMCLKVREGEYPPPPAPDALDVVVSPDKRGALSAILNTLFRAATGVRTYFRECFSHPYYLWFFASLALAEMAYQPINLFSLYFAKSVGMTMQSYGDYGAIQLAISFTLAFPLGWVADKIHPLRLTMIALLLYAITSLVAFFFVRTPGTFAAAHVICGACAGMWLTATAPLGPAILPKLKFMQYISALHIVGSIGRIIIGTACGSFLDYMNRGSESHDYHYIYIWACVLITMSLLASLVVHQKFLAYGGMKHYVAPE